jgi:hypothetical protein
MDSLLVSYSQNNKILMNFITHLHNIMSTHLTEEGKHPSELFEGVCLAYLYPYRMIEVAEAIDAGDMNEALHKWNFIPHVRQTMNPDGSVRTVVIE